MQKKTTAVKIPSITTLFVDVGGVLLTDGWNTNSRKLAAKFFNLDFDAMEARHHLTFDTYESGKINLDEYLQQTIFYQKQAFTRTQFKEFMYSQSKPYHEMIELIGDLKTKYKLKIAVVSNEAYELNTYRIKKFKLRGFVDFFISSCFVHLRKPDPAIFQLALDIAQTPANQIIYIDNQAMFITVAETLGIKGIHHTDYQSTCEKLTKVGLLVA
ncbi:MAG: HAD hydrolase-like protein [Legionellales bacterium]|nr:HAD hydrolase-like protein [Legionellales bacterium]